jgi:SAM-dependent methyltransferase
MREVPAYFDGLIAGFRAGAAGRDVHLGFWDDPPELSAPCSPSEFEAAQARLTEVLLGMGDLADGQDALDVGCGFGGTLAAIGERGNIRRVGVNIDPRQIEICRALTTAGSPLSLVVADACTLPFAAASFDRLFCVEAMFHFASRVVFLREAARVLRPGGRLTLSDILARDPGRAAPLSRGEIEAILRREYGPWPQLWVDRSEIDEAARAAGLIPQAALDATRQTLPTHRVTAPRDTDGLWRRPTAGGLLRWLHASGYLSYLCLTFAKA